MDGWMDEVGWMDRWMDGRMEGSMDGRRSKKRRRRRTKRRRKRRRKPTCVVQSAILDHMRSDFRCQLHDLSIMPARKSQCKALEHIETVFGPLCGWNTTFCYMILSEEGANKVADVLTCVVQDAMLDHMGSDLRCQNEVMTTKNC